MADACSSAGARILRSGKIQAAVRMLVSAVLIAAAVTKAATMLGGVPPTPLPAWGDMPSVALVYFELLLGLWLLSGHAIVLSWTIALAFFAVLACVALWRLLTGVASCGCFGALDVPPDVIFAIDVLCISALAAFHPRRRSATGFRGGDRAAALMALAAGMVLTVGVAHRAVWPQASGGAGLVIEAGRTVELDVESWVGQTFPLVDHITVGDQLTRGRWQVLFYSQACPACRRKIREYIASDAELDAAGQAPPDARLALVEVPPFHSDIPATLPPGAIHGRLREGPLWRIRVPAAIRLSEGVVVADES